MDSAVTDKTVSTGTLTHLARLEAESIQIMREVVAECERPVMLYSIGKDSAVMLHLAMKAFYPAKPPFPLLHVDTTWKFHAMIEFRDRLAKEPRARADRAYEPGRRRAGHQPVHARVGHTHRRHEDPGPQAGAGQVRLRRGVRRRAAR
jgi:3'-phosphoadenosine 5'-phosphosulfate sulfotransferase (PAPS reductase)/FAD synthetase